MSTYTKHTTVPPMLHRCEHGESPANMCKPCYARDLDCGTRHHVIADWLAMTGEGGPLGHAHHGPWEGKCLFYAPVCPGSGLIERCDLLLADHLEDRQRQRTESDYNKLLTMLAVRQLEKLRANHHKQHWLNQSLPFLLDRLADDVQELRDAVRRSLGPGEVWKEAADVSNIAAMIADRYEHD